MRIWEARQPADPRDYPRVSVSVNINPHDLWVGVFWEHLVQGWDGGWWESRTVYVCPLPMVAFKVYVDRSNRDTRARRKFVTTLDPADIRRPSLTRRPRRG